jgi:hypothetical protein
MRRLLVVAAAVVVGLGAVRLAVQPVHLVGYRVIDPYNIALQMTGASPVWRGVTVNIESNAAVTLEVSEFRGIQFGAGFGDERIAYVAVRLQDPLAGREVIDAFAGAAVPLIAE